MTPGVTVSEVLEGALGLITDSTRYTPGHLHFGRTAAGKKTSPLAPSVVCWTLHGAIRRVARDMSADTVIQEQAHHDTSRLRRIFAGEARTWQAEYGDIPHEEALRILRVAIGARKTAGGLLDVEDALAIAAAAFSAQDTLTRRLALRHPHDDAAAAAAEVLVQLALGQAAHVAMHAAVAS